MLMFFHRRVSQVKLKHQIAEHFLKALEPERLLSISSHAGSPSFLYSAYAA